MQYIKSYFSCRYWYPVFRWERTDIFLRTKKHFWGSWFYFRSTFFVDMNLAPKSIYQSRYSLKQHITKQPHWEEPDLFEIVCANCCLCFPWLEQLNEIQKVVFINYIFRGKKMGPKIRWADWWSKALLNLWTDLGEMEVLLFPSLYN